MWKLFFILMSYVYRNFKNDQILIEAQKELMKVARRSEPSVLRERTFDGFVDKGWVTNVLEELSTRVPTVQVLCSLYI